MRFLSLDGWRGVAALAVVVFHSGFLGNLHDVSFVRNSHLFVDFFFVLSGFVITHAYQQRLREPAALMPFVIRRFGRLWPLHIVVLAAFVLLELVKLGLMETGQYQVRTLPFTGENSVASLISNLFLAQALGMHDSNTWNAPSWSISVEFYTYLLFAMVVMLSGRYVRLMALLLAAGSLLLLAASPNDIPGVWVNTQLTRCIAGFFFGHLTYRVYLEYGHRFQANQGSTPLEIAAAVLIVLFVASTDGSTAQLLAPPLFSVIVLVFALENGGISRALKRAPFRQFGEWSYSIYMVHAFVVVVALRGAMVLEKLTGNTLRVAEQSPVGGLGVPKIFFGNAYLMDAMTLVYVLTVILLSSLTYRYVEEPGRSYFNRIAARSVERQGRRPTSVRSRME